MLVKELGNMSKIECLLNEGHPVNVSDKIDFTPLHDACATGSLEYVEVGIVLYNFDSSQSVTILKNLLCPY